MSPLLQALANYDNQLNQLELELKAARLFLASVRRSSRPPTMMSLLRHGDMSVARRLFRGTVSCDPHYWFGHTPVYPELLIQSAIDRHSVQY
jgi:hypothetical protein